MRRAPSFIPRRYGIEITRSVDNGVELQVTTAEGSKFTPGRLAQGYHLWLQLALTDVAEQLVTAEDAILHAQLEDDAAQPADSLLKALHPDRQAPGIDEAIAALAGLERVWLRRKRAREFTDEVDDSLQMSLDRTPRLYIVDEPERHLHPAL